VPATERQITRLRRRPSPKQLNESRIESHGRIRHDGKVSAVERPIDLRQNLMAVVGPRESGGRTSRTAEGTGIDGDSVRLPCRRRSDAPLTKEVKDSQPSAQAVRGSAVSIAESSGTRSHEY